MKFGGTSLATPSRVRDVANRLVARIDDGDQAIAVVSAMGTTTDDLIALAHSVNENPNPHEMDVLLATGEQISVAILAMAIESLGYKTATFTGAQAGFITDSIHSKAKIEKIEPSKINEALSNNQIAIVAGFQGITTDGEITTLGRGGSDTTAVAIAAATGADICEIYSDVDGVYTCDPRVVPKAKKIENISYDEMMELSGSGAGVLHMRAVEFARNFKVKMHCRSAFSYERGTIVKEEDDMEKAIISGIAFDDSEIKITIRGLPDNVGVAAKVFNAIAAVGANIDMIVQNVSENDITDISFTTPKSNLSKIEGALGDLIVDLGSRDLSVDESISKVSLIGAGMKSHPGVAAKMFSILADNGINIHMISTSSIRVSVIVSQKSSKKAVKCLHTGFDLDSDKVFEETQLSAEELKAKAEKGRQ